MLQSAFACVRPIINQQCHEQHASWSYHFTTSALQSIPVANAPVHAISPRCLGNSVAHYHDGRNAKADHSKVNWAGRFLPINST